MLFAKYRLMAVLLCIGAFGWFAIQLDVFGQAINGAIQIFTDNAVTFPRWLHFILMLATGHKVAFPKRA